ncbi:HAD family hydrolase [Tenacibaculum xiamenense]|uniref:HAD family hydrolase n=1 Tax=Tenacibaculum xiamenense TaxID=1261553 RepID=UPI0038952C70
MNISFDLDGTLIPFANEFETEPLGKIPKYFGIERLRLGSKKLISELRQKGHEIHIYTTSFRSKRTIRRTFNFYGIKIDRIVNQRENQKVLYQKNIGASKFPPEFNFDIHIDDLKGVGLEGETYNFKTIIIEANQMNWSEMIKNEIDNFLI